MNSSLTDQALSDIFLLKARIDEDILPMDALDKFLLSRMYYRGDLKYGWNDRAKGQRAVTNGKAFSQAVLPFSDCYFVGENSEFEYVNPFRVLAGAYYDVPQLSSSEAANLANTLDAQCDSDNAECAHYVRIGDMALYIASEGKNRVSLYREINRPIRARVCKTSYPPSHYLQLTKILPFGGVGVRYIGDDEEVLDRLQGWQALSSNVAALPFVESVRLLESCGVQWGDSEWHLLSPIVDRRIRLYVCRRKYIS